MWFKHGVFRKAQICLKMSETEGSTLPCCKPRTDRMFGGNAICSLPKGLTLSFNCHTFRALWCFRIDWFQLLSQKGGLFLGGGGNVQLSLCWNALEPPFWKLQTASPEATTHMHTHNQSCRDSVAARWGGNSESVPLFWWKLWASVNGTSVWRQAPLCREQKPPKVPSRRPQYRHHMSASGFQLVGAKEQLQGTCRCLWVCNRKQLYNFTIDVLCGMAAKWGETRLQTEGTGSILFKLRANVCSEEIVSAGVRNSHFLRGREGWGWTWSRPTMIYIKLSKYDIIYISKNHMPSTINRVVLKIFSPS